VNRSKSAKPNYDLKVGLRPISAKGTQPEVARTGIVEHSSTPSKECAYGIVELCSTLKEMVRKNHRFFLTNVLEIINYFEILRCSLQTLQLAKNSCEDPYPK